MSLAALRMRYWAPAICSICGADAVTNSDGNYAQWTGHDLVHIDPDICRYVLQARAKLIIEAEERIKVVANG